jgi:hypothetical protein
MIAPISHKILGLLLNGHGAINIDITSKNIEIRRDCNGSPYWKALYSKSTISRKELAR